MHKIGQLSYGNSVKPYCDGVKPWEDIWETISMAKDYVWVSTFIIEDDPIGRKTIDMLRQAALRGCSVVLIYDCFGSWGVKQSLFEPLREAGGVVIDYKPIARTFFQSPWNWKSPFVRVHQKLLSVDGGVVFCGGMNITSDYADPIIGGTGRFKDTHCRLEGPAVASLERTFIRTLKICCPEWQKLVERRNNSHHHRSNPIPSFYYRYKMKKALRRIQYQQQPTATQKAQKFLSRSSNYLRTKLTATTTNTTTTAITTGSTSTTLHNTIFSSATKWNWNESWKEGLRRPLGRFEHVRGSTNMFNTSINHITSSVPIFGRNISAIGIPISSISPSPSSSSLFAPIRRRGGLEETVGLVQVLESTGAHDPSDEEKTEIQNAFLNAIDTARISICITEVVNRRNDTLQDGELER
eukprot:TRINITY_DN2800_c0_g3_i7.p1 TRINITY_DN2800_c0_g3~~TRINITY_DN2800_c0_g3_i7.p1  ORF type:complete len:411 (-),score=79.31 TRINITY_DN2800_c0_g3_i7:1033-2265(-)